MRAPQTARAINLRAGTYDLSSVVAWSLSTPVQSDSLTDHLFQYARWL